MAARPEDVVHSQTLIPSLPPPEHATTAEAAGPPAPTGQPPRRSQGILQDLAFYTLATYLIQPLLIISTVIVRRELGPLLAGVLATLALVMSYATYSNLGVLTAAERELPFLHGAGDTERYERVRETAFTLTVGAGLLSGLVLAAWTLSQVEPNGTPLAVGLLTYAVYVALQQWSFYCTTELRVRQRFVFLSKANVLLALATSVGNVTGVLWFGFPGVLWSTVLAVAIQAVVLGVAVRPLPALRVDWGEARQLVAIGIPLLGLGIALTGVRTVDNLVVLKFLGTEALGLYSIALMANTTLYAFTNSLSVVLYPRMQRDFGSAKSVESLAAWVTRPTLAMGLALGVLCAAVYLAVPVLVTAVMPRFIGGLAAFRIITLGTYLLAMFQMSASFLTSINKQWHLSFLIGIVFVVSAALGALAAQIAGTLWAVALATVAGYFLCFVSVNVFALRHWLTPRAVARFLVDALMPGVYAALLLVLLDGHFTGTTLLAMVLGAALRFALFLALYAPILWLLESRTGLLERFVRPAVRRVLRRA